MFDSSNAGKIAVRNLPNDVMQALADLAGQHDRSTEAEARYAIRAWVAPQLTQYSRTSRMAVLGQRLNYLLNEISGLKSGAPVPPSRVAYSLGATHADAVERWFAGEDEPSFAELAQISSVFGCSCDWLTHGEGQPFRSEYVRIPEDAMRGADWLLQPFENGGRAPELFLIRNTTDAGEFAFVKQYTEWHATVYRTPYHVSEDIGAGGEASLAWLTLVFECLYKRYTKLGASDVQVQSYLVEDKVFSALLEGKRHPLNVLRSPQAIKSCWWEDIWDENQFPKQNYWPGWSSVAERMFRVVEARSTMKAQREAIRGAAGVSNEC